MGFVKDIVGGLTGSTASKASNKAGQLQADASKQAGQIAQQQYEQSRNDLMPWMNAGKNAIGGFESFVNGTGNNAAAYSDMLKNGVQGLNLGGNVGGTGAGSFGNIGTSKFNDAMMPTIQKNYDAGKYTGDLSQEDFQVDPSYEFRKQQGMDGIQGSAAASGSLLSGAALKSLNSHNSNLASQEYGNAWARDQAVKQQQFGVDTGLRGQNYDMYAGDATRALQANMTNAQLNSQTSMHNSSLAQNAQIQNQNYGLNALGLLSGIGDNEYARKYNGLSGLVGMGQNAAAGMGDLGALNTDYQGNALIGGANARANGLTTGAAAQSGALQNLLGLGVKAFGIGKGVPPAASAAPKALY